MINKSIYVFPHPNTPSLSEVGGKGLSLVLGSQAGLPVPHGFILSVNFFTSWFEELQQTEAWSLFLKANEKSLEKTSITLKTQASKLLFTKHQEKELYEVLNKFSSETLFAVRSSSPEEDLEGSSFAGGYETVLGVTPKSIKHAIVKAFASCLDYRVAVYKRENGFDITHPKIAIIIQEQIASEIAGVGFSLNPVTNNYDEAVFNANWGLGETVVSGTATPDTYIVDKTEMKVKDKIIGAKEITIRLLPNGGTKEERNNSKKELTLSDAQILKLTELIKKVEVLYKKPIDIEWAFAKEKLYLLQARPITTYIPLYQTMLTSPGEKKRLYIDFTLSLQGINQPLSVVSTSFFHLLLKKVGGILFFRDITKDITTTIPWISPGRLYLNISNVLKLVSKEKFVNFVNILDPLAAKTIQSINEKQYISDTNKIQLLPLGALQILPKIAVQVFRAKHWPEQTHKNSQQRLQRFMEKTRELVNNEPSYIALSNKLLTFLITDVVLNTPPLFVTGKMALGEMKKIAGKDLEHAFAPLEVALPNNVTTEMGLSLSHVSDLLPPNLTETEIKDGIRNKTLPQSFLSAWDTFINKYGFRGPLELDIATPRYEDQPELLIPLINSMKKNRNQDNPQETFRKNQEKSRKTYEYLYNEIQKKGKKKAEKFKKYYIIFETFAGYRESHKFYVIFALSLLRQKIVRAAKILYASGRLDSVEQVFDLTLEELELALSDPTFNLIERAKKNREFIDKLAHVPNLPTIIDSRGIILRPPTPPTQKGEVIGVPISPGIVQGKIKVLHTPNEKPFSKGDILVARATDPGWTPLFVNASAIILEIGGVLQHGALVAREYGLPCVAGIENATSLWKDGTLVEVNGTEGTISLVKK